MASPQRVTDLSGVFLPLLAGWDVWQAGEDRWRACCPIHKGDNPSAFSISRRGFFNCFRCGAKGGTADLLVALRGLTWKQALEYVAGAPQPFSRFPETQLMPPWSTRREGVAVELLPEATIIPYKGHCPKYLVNRGFSPNVLRRFDIGYNAADARIVIPVRDVDGALAGLTFRVDYPTRADQAKYWHDNFIKTKHLYGFYRWADVPVKNLYLVEGQLDAVRLAQLGLPSAAIMGSSLAADQLTLLQERAICDQLVLMLDNDDAGRFGTEKAVEALCKTRFARSLGVARYDAADPGDMQQTNTLTTVPWYEWLFTKKRKGRH